MNKMIEWAEALESGEYTQGVGFLRQEAKSGTVRHCCLGVYCEINDEFGFQLGTEGAASSTYDAVHNQSGSASDGRVPGPGVQDQDRYIEMNDVSAYTFEEIAAEIRKDNG